MAISGTAFAQGLLSGAGQAGQRYFEDMRRQRLDDMKLQKTFDMFTKQTDYSAAVQAEKEKGIAMYKVGLEDIKAKNTQRSEWERVSKLSTEDIVYENALKFGENFAPADRPAAVRDYLKRKSGIDKVGAMNDRGLTLPDYSQYKDNPEYADAIPKQYLAGDPTMPDADSMFTLDPQAGFMQELQTQAQNLTDYDKKRIDALNVIRDSTLLTFQAEPSPRLASLILGKRGKEGDVVMNGATVSSLDNTRISSMITSGQVFRIGGQLKLKDELTTEDRQLLGLPTDYSPDTKPAPTYSGKDFVDPVKADYLETKEEEARVKAEVAEAKAVGDKYGKLISSYGALEELQQASRSLSDGAKQYLYGSANWKGVGAISDRVTQLAAKVGDKDAQEAAAYLSLVTNITARIKHDQYGSAQTATELKDFASQLGRPGFFQNPDTLLDQVEARKASVGRDIRSSIGESARTAYMNQHQEDPYIRAAFGFAEEPEKKPEDLQGTLDETRGVQTNPTVSDSATSRPTEAQLMATGKYTPEQVKAYLAYLDSLDNNKGK